jgi:hypothetical protein
MANDYDEKQFNEVLKRGQEALDRSRDALSNLKPSSELRVAVEDSLIEDLRRQRAERFALDQKIRADIHDMFISVVGQRLTKRSNSGVPASNSGPKVIVAAPSREMSAARASLPTNHPETQALPLAEKPPDEANRCSRVASACPSSAPSGEDREFHSQVQRIEAVSAYTKSWHCSEAALARTARVDPADFSKWKKDLLPAASDKKARIEKVLKSNAAPTRSEQRPRKS